MALFNNELETSDKIACFRHILKSGQLECGNDMVNLCRNAGVSDDNIESILFMYTNIEQQELPENMDESIKNIKEDKTITCDTIKNKYKTDNMCVICQSASQNIRSDMSEENKTKERDIIKYLLNCEIKQEKSRFFHKDIAKETDITKRFTFYMNIGVKSDEKNLLDFAPIYGMIYSLLNQKIKMDKLFDSTKKLKELISWEDDVYKPWTMAYGEHCDKRDNNAIIQEEIKALFKEDFRDSPDRKKSRNIFLGLAESEEEPKPKEKKNKSKSKQSSTNQDGTSRTRRFLKFHPDPGQLTEEKIIEIEEYEKAETQKKIDEIKAEGRELGQSAELKPIPVFTLEKIKELGYTFPNAETDFYRINQEAVSVPTGICLDVIHIDGSQGISIMLLAGKKKYILSTSQLKKLSDYIGYGKTTDEEHNTIRAKITTTNIMALRAVIIRQKIKDIRTDIVQPSSMIYLAYVKRKGQSTATKPYLSNDKDFILRAYARTFQPGTEYEDCIILNHGLPVIIRSRAIKEGEIVRGIRIENALTTEQWHKLKYMIVSLLEFKGILKGYKVELWKEDTEGRTLYFVVGSSMVRGFMTILKNYTEDALKEENIYNPILYLFSPSADKTTPINDISNNNAGTNNG